MLPVARFRVRVWGIVPRLGVTCSLLVHFAMQRQACATGQTPAKAEGRGAQGPNFFPNGTRACVCREWERRDGCMREVNEVRVRLLVCCRPYCVTRSACLMCWRTIAECADLRSRGWTVKFAEHSGKMPSVIGPVHARVVCSRDIGNGDGVLLAGPCADRFCASKDAAFVFLLSTRAGGLGINLTSADTVCTVARFVKWVPRWNCRL